MLSSEHSVGKYSCEDLLESYVRHKLQIDVKFKELNSEAKIISEMIDMNTTISDIQYEKRWPF